MRENTAEATVWSRLPGLDHPRAFAAEVAVILALGVGGGFLSFVYVNTKLIPEPFGPGIVFALLAVLGAYASPLAGQLARSMTLLVWSSAVSLVVHMLAWVWPLVMLVGDAPLAGIAYVAVKGPLGEAFTGWLFVFPFAFVAGYLTYVLIVGYFWA